MIVVHYNLFISSTFKDMDVERDIVKFEVIPALNQQFNPYGVAIHAIDLRYGVNTSGLSEAEASDKVLNMCVQSIDRARPFFVGFIGDRYGWVPSAQRWGDFYAQLDSSQQALLSESQGLSITEMEILYSGFFSDDAAPSRYLFCLRDTATEPEERVRKLRDKIIRRCDEQPSSRYFTYHLQPTDGAQKAPGLAERLISEIGEMIRMEVEQEAPLPHQVPRWAAEINENRMRMINMAEMSVRRPQIEQHIEDVDCGVLISGPSFSGKSTILAMLYTRYFYEDWENQPEHRKILLTARVNHSQYSRNIHQIMGRWVIELFALLGIEQEEEMKNALIQAHPAHHQAIQQMFYQAVDIIRVQGHSVHIFIDDLDQFLFSSPGDEKLEWMDDRVRVYATCNSDALEAGGLLNLPMMTLCLMDVVDDPHHTLLNAVKLQNFCELPDEVCANLAGDAKASLLEQYEQQPDYIISHLGKTEYTFLQLNTMFKMARLLNKDDFRQMRAGDTLTGDRVQEMFAALPQDYEALLDHFVQFYTARFGSKAQYEHLIQLLRSNPQGLRVDELVDALHAGISAPDIYNMLYYFDDFISIEYDTEIVKLRHHPQKVSPPPIGRDLLC